MFDLSWVVFLIRKLLRVTAEYEMGNGVNHMDKVSKLNLGW